jgi:hypothetical protein
VTAIPLVPIWTHAGSPTDVSSSPIRDFIERQNREREQRLRDLGITPAPEALPGWRRQKLDELGITDADADLAAEWVEVESSNVEAIRWVGGEYGLQVRFLPKGRHMGSEYEYAAPRSIYEDMLEADSKGQFVWHVLRADNVPYRRLN